MNPRRARVVWYAPFVVPAVAYVGVVGTQLWAGDPLHAITAGVCAVVFLHAGYRSRQEFQRGWWRGFHEGTSVYREAARNEIPQSVVRAAATGEPAPEPWEELTYWN